MKTVSKVASLTLASVLAFTPVAMATGSHNPSPAPAPVGGGNAAANANAAAQSEAAASSSSKAFGGAGGQGGMGGQGGTGVGGTGIGGSSTSATGPINNSLQNSTNIEASRMGTPGMGFLVPAGQCGTGVYGGVGVWGFGGNGGVATQNTFCLKLNNAIQAYNSAIAAGDKVAQAVAINNLGKIVEEYGTALEEVTYNVAANDCVQKQLGNLPAAMLANPSLGCSKDGNFTVKVPASRLKDKPAP